jgi:hypothetical protein
MDMIVLVAAFDQEGSVGLVSDRATEARCGQTMEEEYVP